MESRSEANIKFLVDDEATSLLASPPTTIAAPSRSRGSNRNHTSQAEEEFDDTLSRKQQFNWHVIPLIVGASLMSIMGGTTNAFNIFSDKIQGDLDLTKSTMSLLSGFALLGLYFTLPAGYLLDRFGPFKVGSSCVVLSALSYLAASYCTKDLFALYFILMVIVGFASGGLFLSALTTSLSISPTGGGFGVACVSAAMSLSVAFISFSADEYSKIADCDEDHCWRDEFRMLVIFFVVLSFPGSLLLLFFRREEYPHLMRRSGKVQPKSMKESLAVMKDPFFWSLFSGLFFGIGSCVFLLTQASDIWSDYNHDSDLDTWGDNILMVFSFCNASSNILCGVGSDWLANNNIISHSTFVALVQFLYSIVFTAIGVLDIIPHPGKGSLVVFFLLSSIGLSFGCYLVVFPMVTAETWGANNFGKTFALLSFGSTAASLVVPNVATAFYKQSGHYTSLYFGIGVALFLSSFFMVVIPRISRARKTPGNVQYALLN
mmetsp:Transcript_17032/g.23697  ORF Transcript_17032/g.23697 Transcript_17032/m.23697 type:complete len:489 (+) Transcript_17032:144-1610(+)